MAKLLGKMVGNFRFLALFFLKARGGVNPFFGVKNEVDPILELYLSVTHSFLQNRKILTVAQVIAVSVELGMLKIAFSQYNLYRKIG